MRALVLALTALALAPASAHAQDRTKPTTPTNLRVTAVNGISAGLAWNASTDNSGVFSYRVRETTLGWEWYVPQSQTAYTATSLQPGRTYRFVVYAIDNAGNRSSNSNQVTVNTPAAAPAAVPTGLRVIGATPNTVTIEWNASANAVRYDVQRDGSHTGGSWTTSFTQQYLQPDTSYRYAVRAVNAAGTASAWSAPITVRTPADTTAPSAPAVTVSDVGFSSARLSWPASTDDSSYVSYNVYVNGKPSPHMLPASPTTMDVLNLRDGTTYDLAVAAYDNSGNLSPATHVTVTTPESPDTTPPPAPTSLTAGEVTSHSVRLGWGPWSGFADNFAHEIWMDGALAKEVVGDWRYSGMLFPFTQVRHLQPGSTHTFTAYNRDEAGNLSAPSNTITVTLPASSDTTPPAPPTALTGDTSPNCAFAFFQWSGGGGEPFDVEIFEDGHFLDVWNDEAFMTSFGRHTYTVRYVDRAGNSSAPSPGVVLDHGMRC
jgi:fibronectin type 3 domain-containing protein